MELSSEAKEIFELAGSGHWAVDHAVELSSEAKEMFELAGSGQSIRQWNSALKQEGIGLKSSRKYINSWAQGSRSASGTQI